MSFFLLAKPPLHLFPPQRFALICKGRVCCVFILNVILILKAFGCHNETDDLTNYLDFRIKFGFIVQEISNLLSLDNLLYLILVAEYLCRRAFVCFQSYSYRLFDFCYTVCLLFSLSLSDL